MRRSTPVFTAMALLAVTGCGAATAATTASAHAPGPTVTATVTATGTGTVSAPPDVMTVQIGVQNAAARAAAALSFNNATSAAVQAVLVRHGVAVADIQTTQLSLDPQTTPENRVTGYQITDVVNATLRNLSTAGTVLDDALAVAGAAGRIDGVSFSYSNTASLLARARLQAVAAARSDASQMAAAAGLHLIGLRSITDETNQGGISPEFSSSGGVASAAVPVQAGTQSTSVQVTTVWAVGY